LVSEKSIFQVDLIWCKILRQIQCCKPHIHSMHPSKVTAVQSCILDIVSDGSHSLSLRQIDSIFSCVLWRNG
jgi:hypothetical protein